MNLALGTRLGPYEIVRPLGAGGMGEVYLARDTRLGRTVAVKTVSGPCTDRFEHEARAISALNHPHICTLHDVGVHEGVGYLVMEHVEGEPLKGPMPWREAARLVADICDGLEVAHRKGIVHRDLKPANVLLTPGGVKIIDFGLAKIDEGESATVTAPGTILGTVAYMAPEQAAGRPADSRTDLWAVGVLFYELLTGRLPFHGAGASAIMAEILDPVPLVLSVPPDVPAEAVRILHRLVAKDRAERYQHADDVAVDLRCLVRETAAVAVPASQVSPAPLPTPERRRLSRVLPWLLTLLLVASVAVVIWYARPPNAGGPPGAPRAAPGRIVVFPFENLGPSDDEYFAVGVADEIAARLSAVRGLSVLSRTRAKQYDRRGKTGQQIAGDLGVEYVLDATVRWDRSGGDKGRVRIVPQLVRVSDDTELWGQPFDRVIDDIFKVQSEVARAVVERLGVALAGTERRAVEARPTASLEAYQAYMRGRYLAERSHFTRAEWQASLDAFQRAVDLDPEFAAAWAEVSKGHARLHYLRQDLSADRVRLARRALERATTLLPEARETRMAGGYYLFWCERNGEAALKAFSAVADSLPSTGEAQEAMALVLDAEGELLRMQGRWEESLTAFRRLFELEPRNGAAAEELSLTCLFMHRHEDARAYADQAIALTPDGAWPYLAKAINEWFWKGPTPEARAALESVPQQHEWWPFVWFWQKLMERRGREALQVLERFPGDWVDTKMWAGPDALYAAHAYETLGDPVRARVSYEEARQKLEQRVRQEPDDPRHRSALGLTYAGLGRRADAIREGRKATELLPIEDDAFYGMAHLEDLAAIYAKIGERDLALQVIERLLTMNAAVSPARLRSHPLFAPLAGDPRFEKLRAPVR